MNKVSVVISNYNYGRFVSSAIESCLAQTHPCSVIVVDDASSDDSWDVIQGYVKDGVMAVRLKKNSGGNARGKNVGICLSKTPYITCLDADDLLLPNSIEIRTQYIDQYDFVHGWALSVKSTESYKNILSKEVLRLRNFTLPGRAKKLLLEQPGPRWAFAVEASTVLSNRSLYERFGLYDEEMRWTIDREMRWRWLYHGATKKMLKKYVSIYRRHKNQLTADRSRKDPKLCAKMLKQRIELRETITAENTLLMSNYDVDSFIDRVENE